MSAEPKPTCDDMVAALHKASDNVGTWFPLYLIALQEKIKTQQEKIEELDA